MQFYLYKDPMYIQICNCIKSKPFENIDNNFKPYCRWCGTNFNIKKTMAYIYLNKETNEARIFGSITALCNATGIKPDNLYTCFSRNKLKEFENDQYRIIKTPIERA